MICLSKTLLGFMLALSFLAPTLAWPITHIGTRAIKSIESCFLGHLASRNLVQLSTNPQKSQVTAQYVFIGGFGSSGSQDSIRFLELAHVIEESHAEESEFVSWAQSNDYLTYNIHLGSEFLAFYKDRAGYRTWLIYIGPSMGIYINHQAQPNLNMNVQRFIESLQVDEKLCSK